MPITTTLLCSFFALQKNMVLKCYISSILIVYFVYFKFVRGKKHVDKENERKSKGYLYILEKQLVANEDHVIL